jgi:hypothetical protein
MDEYNREPPVFYHAPAPAPVPAPVPVNVPVSQSNIIRINGNEYNYNPNNNNNNYRGNRIHTIGYDPYYNYHYNRGARLYTPGPPGPPMHITPRPAYAPGYEHLAPRSNLLNINSNEGVSAFNNKENGTCSLCLESTVYENDDPSKKYSNEERKRMFKKLKKCGHIFHEKCIRQVTDGKCPLCRKEFTI